MNTRAIQAFLIVELNHRGINYDHEIVQKAAEQIEKGVSDKVSVIELANEVTVFVTSKTLGNTDYFETGIE